MQEVKKYYVVRKNVGSSQILVTLMMEGLRSSETSVLVGDTRRNITDDWILQRYACLDKYDIN
jgi:hypothetical protein